MKKMIFILTLFIINFLQTPASLSDEIRVELLKEVDCHVGDLECIAFTQNGNYVAFGGDEGRLVVYGLRDMNYVRAIESSKKPIYALDFDPDNRFLACTGGDKTVRLWDYHNARLIDSYKASKKNIYALSISNSGSLIATGGKDREVAIFNYQNRVLEARMKGHKKLIHSLDFHPNGRSLLSSSKDKTIINWNVLRRIERRRLSEPAANYGKLTRSVFGPDGVLFASAIKEVKPAIEGKRQSRGGIKEIDHIQVRNNLTGEAVVRFDGHLETINDIAFSPDGQYIVSASDDYSVRIWSISRGEQVMELQTKEKAKTIAFSPNGRYLAAGMEKGSAIIWKVHGVCHAPVYVARGRRYRPMLSYLAEYKGEPVRIAVIGLKPGQGVGEDTAALLANILQNALIRTGRFELVERSLMKKIIAEQSLQLSELVNDKTTVEIGNVAGARELVVGTLGKVGNQYVAEIRFIDVETSKVLRSEVERGECEEEELFLFMEAIANHAASNLQK